MASPPSTTEQNPAPSPLIEALLQHAPRPLYQYLRDHELIKEHAQEWITVNQHGDSTHGDITLYHNNEFFGPGIHLVLDNEATTTHYHFLDKKWYMNETVIEDADAETPVTISIEGASEYFSRREQLVGVLQIHKDPRLIADSQRTTLLQTPMPATLLWEGDASEFRAISQTSASRSIYGYSEAQRRVLTPAKVTELREQLQTLTFAVTPNSTPTFRT